MTADIEKALNARHAIYLRKFLEADPCAPDDRNRHDALRYVLEALELLAHECGIKVENPMETD